MNCLEFRKRVASDPSASDAEMEEHAHECALCNKYAKDMRALDAQLNAALSVPAPERSVESYMTETTPRVAEPVAAPRKFRFALAASLVAGLGLAIGWQVFQAPNTLGDELIAHILHEPNLQNLPDDARVAPFELASVLDGSQVSLNDDIGEVAHAGLCLFRGKLVAHLIVPTDRGPVTVMMLPDEALDEATPINEEGFVGTIVPAGTGAIAIVGGDSEATRSVENRIVQAVDWNAG